MKRLIYLLGILFVLVLIVILLGPKSSFEEVNPTYQKLDLSIDQVENYIQTKDDAYMDLKVDNESKIYWADASSKEKTEYVVLYLHGFSASGKEGSDTHLPFAQAIGANLYVPRLYDSGRATHDSFKGLTPKAMIESAKEAVQLAKMLGEKVILMSCSTGGTFSAYLAAHDPSIHSLFMFSPNIDLADPTSELILYPWGSEVLKWVTGSEYYHIDHYNDEQKKYWNETYHTDGIIALKYLIDMTMNASNFEKITQPTFISYYFESAEKQDDVVSIDRINDFYHQISTEKDKKELFICPQCESHVISSTLFNKNADDVAQRAIQFAVDKLGMERIDQKIELQTIN